jgi:hypothetical protein
VVSFAESYIALPEPLLRSRNEETRYWIEQMTARRITSDKYLNVVYLVATITRLCELQQQGVLGSMD